MAHCFSHTGLTRFAKGAYIHKDYKVQKIGNLIHNFNNRWRQRASHELHDLTNISLLFQI